MTQVSSISSEAISSVHTKLCIIPICISGSNMVSDSGWEHLIRQLAVITKSQCIVASVNRINYDSNTDRVER